MNTTQQTQTLAWEGPTILHHKRGTLWYVAAIISLGLLIAFCMVAKAWSFLVLVILGAVFYTWLLFKPTPIKHISFSQNGITFEGELFAYGEIKEFWILDHGHDFELHIRPYSRLKTDIRIFLANTDLVTVRGFLQQYIEENTEHDEKFLDILARLLKI